MSTNTTNTNEVKSFDQLMNDAGIGEFIRLSILTSARKTWNEAVERRARNFRDNMMKLHHETSRILK
jgi:hypothetical protein